MQRRWIPLVLCLSVLAGCSTVAPQVPEPVQAPRTEALPKARSVAEWEAEGKRLAEAQRWSEAAHAYEEVAKQISMANRWNQVSYAYLMAKQYDEAIRAAELALAADHSDASALFNKGMAYLESGETCLAIDLLRDSNVRQKGRWESNLALGRAHLQIGRPKQASDYLGEARDLGAPADQVARWQAEIEKHLAPPSAEVLTKEGKLLIQDGEAAFYRWSLKVDCDYNPKQSIWLLRNGKVEQLMAGTAEAEAVESVTLSNGQRAYWVAGDWASVGNYLILLQDGKQERFQFISSLHQADGVPAIADFVLSMEFPVIQGDEMVSVENDRSGLWTHHITWKLDPVRQQAIQVKKHEEASVIVRGFTGSGMVGSFANGPSDIGAITFPLAPEIQVTRAGKPISLAEVAVNQRVTVRMHDRTIFAIDRAR